MFFNAGGGTVVKDKTAFTSFKVNGTEERIKKNEVIPSAVVNVYVDSERIQNSQTDQDALIQTSPLICDANELIGSTVVFDEPITEDLGCVLAFELFSNNEPTIISNYLDDFIDTGVITKIDERTIKFTEKVLDIAPGDKALTFPLLFPMEGDPDNYVYTDPSFITRSYTHTFTVRGRIKSVKEDEFLLDMTKVEDPNNWSSLLPVPKAYLDCTSRKTAKQYVKQLDEAVDPYQNLVGWFADDVFAPDLRILDSMLLSDYIETGLVKVSEDMKTLDFTDLMNYLSLEFIYGFENLPFSKLSFSIFTQVSDTELKIVGNTTTFLEYMNNGLSVDADAQFANIQWKRNIIPDKLFQGSCVTNFSDGAFEYFTTFGSSAFENSRLNSIVIPDTVSNIGDKAFANCHNLQSFTLGANAVNVDFHSVFTGTTRIDNFSISPDNPRYDSRDNCNAVVDTLTNTIVKGFGNPTCPDTIKTIGPSAFQGLSAMTQYTIGANVENIGEKAFYNCTSLSEISIPGNVKTIGNSAFHSCSKATVLTLGENVETIGNYAFNYCSSLTGVTIPGNVKTIGDDAFRNCSRLSAITVHDGVTSIGNGAFYYCSALSAVTLPDTLTFIGYDVFYNSKLPYINNIQYADNLVVQASGSSSVTGYTIKEGTKYIGDRAFTNYNVQRYAKNIVIPSTVKMIGNKAFSGVTGMTSIALSEGLTTIGDMAFYGTNITKAHIPSTVTNIGVNPFAYTPTTGLTVATENTVYRSESNTIIRKEDNQLVSGCKNSIIPQGVEIIGENAFYRRGLTSIIIPDSVNTIKKQAFYGCADATALTIGTGVETIGSSAFYRCSGATELTIGSGVESIGEYAFSGCSKLSAITIPDSVTSIGNSAFNNCTSLSSITIPDSVTSIGSYAFQHCSGATGLTIGSGITTIPYSAFSNCKSLTNITIPGNVTSIEGDVFSYCSSLTSITIPDHITSVGSYAFRYCSGVTELTIGAGVESIESQTFNGCSSLTSITIPDNVTSIENNAFGGCSGATELTIGSGVTSIGSEAFLNCSSLVSITIPDNVKTIGESAFRYCSGATELMIGSGVTNIPYGAFEACNSLTNVIVPNNVTNIGSLAFHSLSLTSITIPSTTNIEYGALCGKNLKDIIINGESSKCYIENGMLINRADKKIITSTVDSNYVLPSDILGIGTYGFAGKDFENITLNEGLTTIDAYAFSGCNNLRTLTLPSTLTTFYSVGPRVRRIYSYAMTPPKCQYNMFGSNDYGIYFYPKEADYSSWKTYNTYGPGYNDKWIGFVMDDTEVDMSFGDYDIVCAYNITNITGTTPIINDLTDVTEIEIDGVVVETGKSYAFTTLGNHVVKYKSFAVSDKMFKDIKQMYDCKIKEGFTEIGEEAFYGCYGLLNMPELPDTIETIGNSAFRDTYLICDELKLPNNLKTIGKEAFDSCYEINNLIIGPNVELIDEYAFYNVIIHNIKCLDCPANISKYSFKTNSPIDEIDLGNNITRIRENAFNTTNHYENGEMYVNNYLISTLPTVIGNNYTVKDDTRIIAGYAFNGSSLVNVTLPDTVKVIDGYAFANSRLLSNIVLPDSLEIVANYAFSGCTSLTSITIPDSVKTIGEYAFRYCSGATELTIGSGVTNIPYGAFYECRSLASITIPDSVKTIGDSAFYGCSGATELTIGSGVESIENHAFSGCTSLTSITIPDSVKTIGDYAFRYCSGATELTIGSSVTSIPLGTFSGCSKLTGITIPDSVTTIGFGAFQHCSGATELTIGSGVTSIPNSAFYECRSLTSITIPGSVRSIGNHAFYDCRSLASITIPDSVTSIGQYAFSGCSSLTSITIPDSVKTIESSAFYGCGFPYEDGTKYAGTYLIGVETKTGTTYTIKDGTRFIGNSAFSGCSKLLAITIPDSVKTIGISAFSGCTSLTSITIPDSVTNIGSDAFSSCGFPYEDGMKYADTYLIGVETKTGTTYTIKDGTRFIGDYALSGCSKLTAITIPDSVTSIKNYAFLGCSSLTSITIPDSVKTIGAHAFQYDSGATELTIGSGVESIGEYAFSGCSKLTAITIPDSVTSVGNTAFHSCSGATELTIGNGVESIEDDAFNRCSSLTSITIPDNVKTIGGYAFRYCSGAIELTIGSGVESIGGSAFYYCSSLTSIIIPDSVKTVGGNAFYGCSGATELAIGSGVESIGDSAFNGCRSLTSITIPDSVKTIGATAFYGCSGATELTIGSSVTSIKVNAFGGCKNLSTVKITSQIPLGVLTEIVNATQVSNGTFYCPYRYKTVEVVSLFKSKGWNVIPYDL